MKSDKSSQGSSLYLSGSILSKEDLDNSKCSNEEPFFFIHCKTLNIIIMSVLEDKDRFLSVKSSYRLEEK